MKVTAVYLLLLIGFIIDFDGIVKCDKAKTKATPSAMRPRRIKKPKKKIYDPNYGYEPYWPGGDWVLYGDPNETTTTQAPQVCGDDCSYIYLNVGKVCGRNIGELKHWGAKERTNLNPGYETFNTYCELLDRACKSAGKSEPKFPRWILVHRGPCVTHYEVYKPMYKTDEPVSRYEFYKKSVAETFKKLGRTPC